jgi:hypothetical protein
MGRRLSGKLIILAVCVSALAAAPALAAISGPGKIKPGTAASFHVTGLPKGATLSVKHTVSGGGGVAVHKSFASNKGGAANVNFNVPRKYSADLSCNSAYAECPTKKWQNGQKVKLKVCPHGGACQTKGLKIKK